MELPIDAIMKPVFLPVILINLDAITAPIAIPTTEIDIGNVDSDLMGLTNNLSKYEKNHYAKKCMLMVAIIDMMLKLTLGLIQIKEKINI